MALPMVNNISIMLMMKTEYRHEIIKNFRLQVHW